MCTGITMGHSKIPCLSPASGKTISILKAIRQQLEAVGPSFRYTAVQFIVNGRAALHTDKHNVGMSMSLSAGPCTGGQL